MSLYPSLRQRTWQMPAEVDADVEAFRAMGCASLLAKVLSRRGITRADVADVLEPRLKTLLPHPGSFRDMDRAVERFVAAWTRGDRIGIFSDYDADGATSAAILGWFLRALGRPDFALHIPDRIHEGYGPNLPALLELQRDGCGLVLILDSGTTAFEPLAGAAEAGVPVIVIDHHAAEARLPDAEAVVNPNRLDETPGRGHLCAAAMTFLFCLGVTRALRDTGAFDGKEGRPSQVPDLVPLLGLVALGTVCDVVPLKGVNRAFLVSGLPILSQRAFPGIAELASIAGIDPKMPITVRDCGFILGPRINAGGRIGSATLGARLLLAQDAGEARGLAAELDALNARRRELEAACTTKALADIPPDSGRRVVIAVVPEAHEGIVGISAARLKDATDCPAIVLTRDPEGRLKGSARSCPGFSIGAALIAARQQGLLIKGGGHGMAGGLTLTPENLAALQAHLDAALKESRFHIDGIVMQVDYKATPAQLTPERIESLAPLAPYGQDNPEPLVLLHSVTLAEIRVLKEKHLKMIFRGADGEVDGLIWNAAGTPLGTALQASLGQAVEVLGRADVNAWQGRTRVQVMVEDLRRVA